MLLTKYKLLLKEKFNIKNAIYIVIIFFILFSAQLLATQNNTLLSIKTAFTNKVVTLNYCDNLFEVEVVDTPKLRARGLMQRATLPTKNGMLFVFKREKPRIFWMKNTLIPLDIIWLNSKKEVVFIKEHTKPFSENLLIPDKLAQYVLEINAGLVKKTGLKKGCKLSFRL